MIQVNQATIEESAVLEEMQYHPAETQREAMLKAAETLIIGELLRQRAAQIGLDVVSDDQKSSQNDYLEALIDKEVYVPEASEQECRQYFESNPERFTTSPLIEARHILLGADPEDDNARIEAQELAEAILKQLNQGGDFAGLANAHSDCPSKNTGGSLGQLSRGQTVPEFERQVFPLEPGLHKDPVETRYGFHLVWIEHKVPGTPLGFDDAHGMIRDYLNEKVRHKAIAQYIHTLITDAHVEGYDFNVSESPLLQ